MYCILSTYQLYKTLLMTNFRSKMEAGEQSELKLYKHYPCILQQKKEMLHKCVSAKMYSRKKFMDKQEQNRKKL